MQTSTALIIEVDELSAGVIVPEQGNRRFFRFVSAHGAFHALDGHRFSTPRAAERAARELLQRLGDRAPSRSRPAGLPEVA